MTEATLQLLIRLVGVGHFVVAAGRAGAPIALGWREELARLRILNRQVFTTYAGCILVINLLFGLVSARRP